MAAFGQTQNSLRITSSRAWSYSSSGCRRFCWRAIEYISDLVLSWPASGWNRHLPAIELGWTVYIPSHEEWHKSWSSGVLHWWISRKSRARVCGILRSWGTTRLSSRSNFPTPPSSWVLHPRLGRFPSSESSVSVGQIRWPWNKTASWWFGHHPWSWRRCRSSGGQREICE